MQGNGIEREACPWCGEVFQAPAGHDPLKHHMDDCPRRPASSDDEWCDGTSGHYHYGPGGRRRLECDYCLAVFTEVPGEVGPGHLPMHRAGEGA